MKSFLNAISRKTPLFFLGILAGFVFLLAFFAGIGASANTLVPIALFFGIITFSIGMMFSFTKSKSLK